MADSPLNQDHLSTCNSVIDACGPALEIARKCKDCGFPADEFIDQLTQQKSMAERIKANFFPNQS